MPRKAKDLSKKRFGKLIAIDSVGKAPSGNYIWRCMCHCGGFKNVPAGNLISGAVRSCGCLKKGK
jgi:hypothetical protein